MNEAKVFKTLLQLYFITNTVQGSFLTLFRMGLFGTAHRWGMAKKTPFPKIRRKYSKMMNLDTGIPLPKEIQKIYKPCDTPFELC